MTQPRRVVLSLDAVKQHLAEQIVAEGGEFRRCANCGCLYPLGTPTDDGDLWTNETVCGERCFDAYVAYLNNPET